LVTTRPSIDSENARIKRRRERIFMMEREPREWTREKREIDIFYSNCFDNNYFN
jgi:hypothetical protein